MNGEDLMKIKKSICAVLSIGIIMCGCTNETDLSKPSTTQITNPFAESMNGLSSEGNTFVNYGVGLNVSYDDFEYMNYENNNLTIPLKI